MDIREKRKVVLKEDATHVLKEMWDTEEGETFYNIFTIEKKRMREALLWSDEDLHKLSWREDGGSACQLKKHEVDDACMLVYFQSYAIAKELFPGCTVISGSIP